MLVEVPVSSIKASRKGQSPRIERRLIGDPGGARRRYVRPLLLAGVHVFFKANALGGKEPPHRAVANINTATGKLSPNLFQRQIRRLRNPRQQPSPFIPQSRIVVAPHRLGPHAALTAPRSHPINHRTDRNLEQLGRLVPRYPALNRRNYPFAQILRVWSCHACWPPPQHAA
jgi:hypothetical protein